MIISKAKMLIFRFEKEENWVKWNDIKILSRDGKVNIYHKESQENSKQGFKEKRFVERANFIVIMIVTLFVTIFIIMFLYLRKRIKINF